eukprot:180480-Rhodomonas_salina.2
MQLCRLEQMRSSRSSIALCGMTQDGVGGVVSGDAGWWWCGWCVRECGCGCCSVRSVDAGPTPWDFEAEDPGMVTHFQLPRNAAQVYRQ